MVANNRQRLRDTLTGWVSTEFSEYSQLGVIEDCIRSIVVGNDGGSESTRLEHVRDAGSGIFLGRHCRCCQGLRGGSWEFCK